VTPSTAFKFGATKNPLELYLSDIYTISLNLAGNCGISIPNGVSKEGLPIGLQLIGPILGEKKILQAAYRFEQLQQEAK
jgi:aspartyl-tRNA(Asn)/glutamyl-tRNA(Gln) amidotransferase subunit A